jgi:hypothetical protein
MWDFGFRIELKGLRLDFGCGIESRFQMWDFGFRIELKGFQPDFNINKDPSNWIIYKYNIG